MDYTPTIYHLTSLYPWARRAGSDKLLYNRDTLVTDGSNAVVLTNDGNILITSITLAGNTLAPTVDYVQNINVITFTSTPAAGQSVIVTYNRSQYTDIEIGEYLVDATSNVIADIALKHWQINDSDESDPQVSYPDMPPWKWINPTELNYVPPEEDWMDDTIERLIVLKSAILIRSDIANQNSNDAILIKDGDTTIDTSKTSVASERSVKRIQDQYDQAFRIAVANRAHGVALQNNWVPLPYPWSTPNMMPGEVNGPTY